MPNISLVLAPVDFSPGSESAAAYAVWLAGRLGARLRVLHVFGGLGHASAGVAPDVRHDLVVAEHELRQQAEAALADLAARVVQEAGGPRPETVLVDATGLIIYFQIAKLVLGL